MKKESEEYLFYATILPGELLLFKIFGGLGGEIWCVDLLIHFKSSKRVNYGRIHFTAIFLGKCATFFPIAGFLA